LHSPYIGYPLKSWARERLPAAAPIHCVSGARSFRHGWIRHLRRFDDRLQTRGEAREFPPFFSLALNSCGEAAGLCAGLFARNGAVTDPLPPRPIDGPVEQEEMMKRTIQSGILIAATLAVLSPAAAVAQDGNRDAEYTTTQTREDDDDFPWGLLGLLGLAGLLGLKRREHRDIHVDARRNP
jgi:MYXO-CTERM domain-containing protein